MNNQTNNTDINLHKTIVTDFTKQQIADMCNTDVREIEDLMEEGVFSKLQNKASNKRDIISSKEEILEIYQEWKNKTSLK